MRQVELLVRTLPSDPKRMWRPAPLSNKRAVTGAVRLNCSVSAGPPLLPLKEPGAKTACLQRSRPVFSCKQFPALARVVGQDKRSAEIQSLQEVFDKILGILQADGAADDVISKRVAKAAS